MTDTTTNDLPDLQMDLRGEYQGNAYPEQRDYRLSALTPRHEHAHVTVIVEDSDGNAVSLIVLSAEAVDEIIRAASINYGDFEYAPLYVTIGMNLTLDTMQHDVRLNEGQIEELAAWLRYAIGDETWTGGETWEY